MKGDRVGAFTIGEPYGHWGGGFYGARDDAGRRVVLQRAFGDQAAAALAREAAWRRAHPHANMPWHVDDGIEGIEGDASVSSGENARAWIAYGAVASVRLEHAMGVHPVPVVLSWATELIAVMAHHARIALPTGHSAALRPAFSDLLVTAHGALLVLTTPAAARTWQTDLLRSSRLGGSMHPPELGVQETATGAMGAMGATEAMGAMGALGAIEACRLDVFAVGAFLQLMLQERIDEPRRDISARSALLVQRASGPLEARHESLDELAHDVRTCLDEFPALDPADRERAVRAVAGDAMADAEKVLRQ